MKRPSRILAAALVALALVVAGCGQGAAPAATSAPAKPAEPTKAAAPAAPTAAPAAQAAAPAKKVDYPVKGRPVILNVPYAAGGSTDLTVRALAPLLEKDLGVPVEVVNKGGGGAQPGTTEVAKAKPDGHTLSLVNMPTLNTIYLDPERKAAFGRKDLVSVATFSVDPMVVAVMSSSPYKTLKDLTDAAKAKPGTIKVATTGVMGDGHMGTLLLEQASGGKFLIVNFDGGAPAMTAMLGGNSDAYVSGVVPLVPHVKSGDVRVLAVLGKDRHQAVPDVPTTGEQGLKVMMPTVRPVLAPAGTPPEVVSLLEGLVKKATEDSGFKSKCQEMGVPVSFLSAKDTDALWDQMDSDIKPLIDAARQSAPKQ